MKVYLSTTNPEDNGFNHFANISAFSKQVMDSEATEIICDKFLSTFKYEEIARLMGIVLSKMRLGCELTIIEPDFCLISKHIFRENADLESINATIFESNTLRSILTIQDVEPLINNPNMEIVSKHFDEDLCKFVIKIKRVK